MSIRTLVPDLSTPDPEGRFLSRAQCAALAERVAAFAAGGGDTEIALEGTWSGNVRWSRNQIASSGDVRTNVIAVRRTIRGARESALVNVYDDVTLRAATRRAERLAQLQMEDPEYAYADRYTEPILQPTIWFDSTYDLSADHRAEVFQRLVAPVRSAGLVAAGYVEVSAQGRAVMNDTGRALYYPYTKAQYSVTVRDPEGSASGWAGVDFSDWNRIDTDHLTQIALDKCQRSRNAVAVEPGRYTAILEPQAVCDLWDPIFQYSPFLSNRGDGPLAGKLGQHVLDPTISLGADPMDPDLGFVPFDFDGNAYHAVQWIEGGVFTHEIHLRQESIRLFAKNESQLNSGAFRMSGGSATIDEMIASTSRGLLVTRFSNVRVLDVHSALLSGVTRDGLWLVERGKISKPVKNFRFVESPFFAFNNVEQLGVPQRVFRPSMPCVVPPATVRDFSFTTLWDAV